MAPHILTMQELNDAGAYFRALAVGTLPDGQPTPPIGLGVRLDRDEWEALGHPHQLEVEL
jgi:hypothetical protein